MSPVWTFHLLTVVLATATAAWAETRAASDPSLSPPGLRRPGRQAVAAGALALVLLLAVFQPLLYFGQTPETNTDEIPVAGLFTVQILLLIAMAIWWVAGWVALPSRSASPRTPDNGFGDHLAPGTPGELLGEGTPEELAANDSRRRAAEGVPGALPETTADASGWRSRLECLKLYSRNPLRELALGLVAGGVAWAGVLMTVIVVAVVAAQLGAEGLVSQPPSEIIVWMAGLNVGLRLLISLSAGVAEELFFRGYLQPRIGLGASTLLFVAAHAGYGRPFMLLGVTLLSLLYGWLSRRRGSIWAAISAHALFDAIQLLVVIPAALRAASSVQ